MKRERDREREDGATTGTGGRQAGEGVQQDLQASAGQLGEGGCESGERARQGELGAV